MPKPTSNNIKIHFKAVGENELKVAIENLSRAATGLTQAHSKLGKALKLTTVEQKKQISTGVMAMRNQRNMNSAILEGASSFSVFRSKLLLTVFAIGLYSQTIGRLTKAAFEQESSERRVEAAIRSTGGAAGVSSETVLELTKRLQGVGVVSDEVNNKVAALLLTFTNVGEPVFERTMVAIQNMSIAQAQGIPTYEQMRSVTIQLGKALQDPVKMYTALAKSGFTFSEAQVEMMKQAGEQNDIMTAQNVILEAAETQYDKLMEVMRETAEGGFNALGMEAGDVAELMGEELIKNLLPIIEALTDMFRWLNNNELVVQVVMKTLRDLIIVVGGVVVAYKIAVNWTRIWTTATITLKAALNPLAGVVALLSTIMVTANIREAKLWQTTRDGVGATKSLTEEIDKQAQAIQDLVDKYDDQTLAMKISSELKINAIKLESAELAGLSRIEQRELERRKKSLMIEQEWVKLSEEEKTPAMYSAIRALVTMELKYDSYIRKLKENVKAIKSAKKAQEDYNKTLTEKTLDAHEQLTIEVAKYYALTNKGMSNDAIQKELDRIDDLQEFAKAMRGIGAEFDLITAITKGFTLEQIFVTGDGTLYAELMKQLGIQTRMTKEEFDKWMEGMKEGADEALPMWQQALDSVMGSFQNFASAREQLTQEKMQREMEALKATSDYENATQEKREVMENKISQKFRSERLKNFKINKLSNIANAIMNTAKAYTAALDVNPIYAAMVAALGTAQVNLIRQQPAPKFAVGGSFITSGATPMLVGESGAERVTVQPLSGKQRTSVGSPSQTININISAPLVDDTILDVIIPKIKEAGKLNLA